MEIPAPFVEQLDKQKIERKSIEAVNQLLETIDLQMVDALVYDLYKKVHGPVPQEEYPINGDFGLTIEFSEENYAGRANGHDIYINAKAFTDTYGDLFSGAQTELLHAVIHEILHQTSWGYGADKEKDLLEYYSGVQIRTLNDEGKEKETFNGINEALTETITDAIYAEYFARSGETKDGFPRNKKTGHLERSPRYQGGRIVLEKLIAILSHAAGMSEENVYQSLVLEYFKNGNLMRSELLEEYRDIPDLVDLMYKIEISDPMMFSLENYAYNDTDAYAEAMRRDLELRELSHIKALFGRDYIGEQNQRQHVDRKFFNVLR